jgi:dipeptidyl aminopeptidase/acylaminoacyl peptidase
MMLAFALLAAAGLGAGCAGRGADSRSSKATGGATTRATRDVAAAGDLIPRKVLFDNPDRSSVQISPDGRHISFLAPRDGVMNVYVAPTSDPSNATPVTNDRTRGIPFYFWAYDSKHVLYGKDQGGNENWNIFAVNVNEPDQPRNLTPNDKVAAQINGVSHKHPEEILVGVNDRDPRFHDVYKVNIRTGEKNLLAPNPGEIDGNTVGGFIADDDYNVRFAVASTPDGGNAFYKPRGELKPGGDASQWEPFDRVGSDDALTTSPEGFDKSGRVLYLSDSRGRDTAGLFALDTRNGEKTLLAEDNRADVGPVLIHPTEKNVQAVSFNYDRQHWKVLDDSIQGDFDTLRNVADGEFFVNSRSLDDKTWIVSYMMDDGPVRYYRYDRPSKQAHFLFTNRKQLEGLPLAKMHPVIIKSRDGLNLVNYLTLPRGTYDECKSVSAASGSSRASTPRPKKPLPMVLLVHGGPWGRDAWGLNGMHQWLANRGYAVLSVNFRGSTGFGKNFVNAGNMEWAGKMHDDLIDSVNWAVKNGIADKDKVAIMGGSYGGFATLVGLTFTPDTFAAGVDIVGPSRIVTLFETIPPYWVAGLNMFKKRVGDHTTPEGRKFLDSRSPLTHVDRIKKPLLIGQGANDPRVKQAEADQIVKAMKEKNLPVVYVLYKDEGHGFQRPENRLSFNAVTEQFLAEHLGGRAEPIKDDFRNSSIAVPEGARYVKGVNEVLSQARPASGEAPASKPAAATD